MLLNQEPVREKLRQKKYDDISLSSWGRLDEFISFITSFGLFAISEILRKSCNLSGSLAFGDVIVSKTKQLT
ncbi:MAG: hypothetical protein BWK80_45480 [Desulfobacteraceae bacterium IS3]|nr:MAG: hypothetical protein BWK80_45480 [Desulfobacteraceae bacterium IS3]